MMGTVLTRAGAEHMIRNMLREDTLLRIFVNDVAPRMDDTLSSFVEPQAGGYEPKTLQAASWNVSGFAATHPEVRFEFNGPIGMLHGWFLTTVTGTILIAERIDAPLNYSRFGGVFRIAPFFQLRRPKG